MRGQEIASLLQLVFDIVTIILLMATLVILANTAGDWLQWREEQTLTRVDVYEVVSRLARDRRGDEFSLSELCSLEELSQLHPQEVRICLRRMERQGLLQQVDEENDVWKSATILQFMLAKS